MKLLTHIFSKVFYVSIGLYSFNTYANTCTVYRDSYSGYSVTMNNGDYISNLEHFMIERRSWHGYWGGGWKGYDVSFNDRASSVILGNNCTLTIYEHIHRSGKMRKIANHNQGTSYRHFDEVGMNETASSLDCNCSNSQNTMFSFPGGWTKDIKEW
ncbi:MAG: hypothetical protein K2X69_02260 [Silvanigrellaceae bacterium]|nr:hypothetical protein [Silvanigrellaceae bacterium]